MGSSVSSTAKKFIMPVTREFVEGVIASDTVVIFSKSYCPYCKIAKEVNKKFFLIKKQIENWESKKIINE